MDEIKLKKKFRGSLLGLALGDSLGAPFEGVPPDGYSFNCSRPLYYTDDTEMMLGLTESIIENRDVLPEKVAEAFIRNLNPYRGYGPGTLRVLSLIQRGVPLEQATRMVFPEGSYGNGAAMRVAPVGLVFYKDMKRLLDASEKSSITTHTHPLGIEGARVIAASVGLILQGVDRNSLVSILEEIVRTEEFKEKLEALKELLNKEASKDEVIERLGNGVVATESVVTSLYAFLRYGDSFENTINFCISLGGDTDTIGAMASALTGAYLSDEGLPSNCLTRLEDYERIVTLADKLFVLSESI
jgi:poly(ADP-ribose) glycohydrolase ARH3